LPSTGDGRSVVWLDEARCWDLLRSRSIGRLAVEQPGRGPLVVPVAYVVKGRTIVFRTALGTKVDALLAGAASFQVDDVDSLRRTGWSVLVDGHAAVRWAEDQEAPHGGWVSWHLPLTVTLTPDAISGREVVLVHPETDPRGYR
jgi:hypothetical protein